jgi:hypothetical protein
MQEGGILVSPDTSVVPEMNRERARQALQRRGYAVGKVRDDDV